MTMNQTEFVRATHRLNQSEGYLELGMVQHALDRLDSLDEFGELGPLAPAVAMLRGRALWMQGHFHEAAESLRTAAQTIPAPHDRHAWLALSACYRQSGDLPRALDTLAKARGANRRPPR